VLEFDISRSLKFLLTGIGDEIRLNIGVMPRFLGSSPWGLVLWVFKEAVEGFE